MSSNSHEKRKALNSRDFQSVCQPVKGNERTPMHSLPRKQKFGSCHASNRSKPPPTPKSLKTKPRLSASRRRLRSGNTLGSEQVWLNENEYRAMLLETKLLFDSPFRTLSSNEKVIKSGENDYSECHFSRAFVYIHKLGDGVCGVVHKVMSKREKRYYALKRYKRAFSSLKERRKLLRSMNLWAGLNPHKNIVQLYCAWQEEGHMCLQMHLCDGGNLLSYVDNIIRKSNASQFWQEQQIWRSLHDCLQALSYIHEKGILHNDIKPSNLYVSNNGFSGTRVMLGDFDKVSLMEKTSIEEEGDPKYLSKEVLHEQSSVFSDIFALGISFYELAAQVELPENGEMWHLLREGALPEFQGNTYSEPFFKLLANMMDPLPSKRPQAHQILHTSSEIAEAKLVELEPHIYKPDQRMSTSLYGESNSSDLDLSSSSSTSNYSKVNILNSSSIIRTQMHSSVLANQQNEECLAQEENSPRRCLLDDFVHMEQHR